MTGVQSDLVDDRTAPPSALVIFGASGDLTRRKLVPRGTPGEDLLVPIYEGGRRVYDPPALSASRARTIAQLAGFHAGVKRLVNPHKYPVGLERKLHDLKTALVLQARHIDPIGAAV